MENKEGKTDNIKLNEKQKAVILSLLNVAIDGWYSEEVLPEGVKSVNEAEELVKLLIYKLTPYPKNIRDESGVGILKRN